MTGFDARRIRLFATHTDCYDPDAPTLAMQKPALVKEPALCHARW